MEASTGSALAGTVTQIVLDAFNPVLDAVETEQLLDEILVDAIEASYDVNVDEEDVDLNLDAHGVFGERLQCERGAAGPTWATFCG